ncbi:HAMP domain-containing protein [Trinickia dinghuensis]|uniref:HAMP domain-containing protein n=1 Tax=Trinickia dinghuensis TaxID=2291023 RepID=A0A3D8K6T2_9BURK|nr:HAMP domain-containing protein [Trinickia dinghuensis]
MKRFVQSVRFKIFVAFGVFVMLMAAVEIFGAVGLSRVNANMRGSYTGSTVPIADLSDIRAALLDIRLQLHLIEVYRDAGRTKTGLERIHTDQTSIDRAWKRYVQQGARSEKEHALVDQIKKVMPQFNTLTAQLVGELGSGSYFSAVPDIDSHEEIAQSFGKLIEDAVSLHNVQAREFADDSDATYRHVLSTSLALASLSIVAGTALAFYLSGAVVRPLKGAVWVANRIAGGTLGNPFDEKRSQDEFGQLLLALQTMDRQLGETVGGIKASSESVNVAAREIASGNADLSMRTEEQAASLGETASSMTQLTETVRQNAENARQANMLATRASEVADAGNGAMQEMVKTIEAISGSSTRISEITAVIESIAFQTNILALNAAVEAARAGEQGRGFAVVASEVRGLAQRSADAAKEIKALLGSSVETIRFGAKQAAEVGSTIGEVVVAIKRVSDIVGEIASASEEQSRGIDQVQQAVLKMDEVTQQNAALVEQAAAAAESLEEQAVTLERAVSVFKVLDEGARAG